MSFNISIVSVFLTFSQIAAAESLKAQYDPVSRVLLSSGIKQMGHYHQSTNPEILEDGTYLEEYYATEEANDIYRAISLDGAPTLLLASDAIPERFAPYMKVPRSEYSLAKSQFKDLVDIGRMTIVSLPAEILKDPKYTGDEDHLFPDRWIRDWGPSNIENLLLYNSGQSRNELGAPEVSTQLKMPVSNSNYFPVGGTFMKTSNGICAFSAVVDPIHKTILGGDAIDVSEMNGERLLFFQKTLGCKKTLAIEPLPLEPMGHLDLFVKFLSDKTVAVARYADDKVQIRAIRKIKSKECLPSKIADSCNQKYNRNYFSGSISQIEAKDINFGEVPAYLSTKYPNINREYAEQWGSLGSNIPLNLKDFSDHLVNQLKTAGFDVIEIIQPQPVVTISLVQEKDQTGSIKINRVHAVLAFPTYLNSILLNKTAFIPSYKYWGDEQKNQAAVTQYKSAGYNIQVLSSDFIILEGGTIHCITKEIH